MRDGIVWIFALLALPGIAAANGARPDAALGSLADNLGVSAGVDATAAPTGLDLEVDPLPPAAQGASNGARAIAPARPERYTGAESQASDRGLSFGLELRRRNASDNLARVAEPDEPGLQDDLERLIDRSGLGLRGRYRF
jgi:hypothetical protein